MKGFRVRTSRSSSILTSLFFPPSGKSKSTKFATSTVESEHTHTNVDGYAYMFIACAPPLTRPSGWMDSERGEGGGDAEYYYGPVSITFSGVPTLSCLSSRAGPL